MAVEFRCRDVGVVCSNVAEADSVEELLEAVRQHARQAHDVELNQTLLDYAASQARDTGSGSGR